MYVPEHFREDRLPELHSLIAAARLAQLVTHGVDGLFATALPMWLDRAEGPRGTLYGHVARANPHWRLAQDGDALAIFMGPDAYISPSWYASKAEHGKVVPTWNYVAVHAYGPVEFFEDAERLHVLVNRLTQKHEQSQAQPWAVEDAPTDYIAGMLRAIVGVRLPISRLEGKRKLSQNRSTEDRHGVAAGLAASPDALDLSMSRLIPG